jgi:hypothetical protein
LLRSADVLYEIIVNLSLPGVNCLLPSWWFNVILLTMASAGRKVMVSFGVPPNVRKKIVVLEDHSTRVKSDLDSLREKMLAILLEDGSIFDVGGSKLTKVRDLLVYVYDSDFEIDVEMSSEHILNHGEKSLSLKIRNPQLIPHAGIYRSVICVVCVHFVLFNLFILYFILQKLIQEPNY